MDKKPAESVPDATALVSTSKLLTELRMRALINSSVGLTIDARVMRESLSTIESLVAELDALRARIRQLEDERVPDYTGGDAELLRQRVPEGWRIVERNTGSIIVYKEKIGSCVVSECPETERTIPEAILWALAKDILAAAPAQEKA